MNVNQNKPLIAVIGGTGAQGGSVVRHLQRSGKFNVRALTRNPNAEKAKELSSSGVEVVKADVNNRDDLAKAFTGAYGVYSVTAFFDPELADKPEQEVVQGKLIADVAAEVGVTHLIWSSLPDIEKISNGKYKVIHFSLKNRVEQYIRSLASQGKFKYVSFVYAGWYFQNVKNWGPLMPITKSEDGTVIFRLPANDTTAFAWYDIEDHGGIVVKQFEEPEHYNNKIVRIASEYLTFGQIAEIYSKVTGTPAKFVPMDRDEYYNIYPQGTFYLLELIDWCNEYGHFNGEDTSEAKRIFPQLKTLEDYIKAGNSFI